MNKIKIMTKQVISYSFGRQVRLLALAVLFLAPFWAWGQTDYSGVYYIGSVGYNSSTPAINYYLCPTEGWCYYAPDDDFTGTDNGNPFLTTYQCRGTSSYDERKAIWTIEKAPNSDYYYIKQTSTGKYILSNGQIRTADVNRMRVHLEAVSGDLDDKALFAIEPFSTYLTIRIVSSAGINGNNKWFTVNGGNKQSLKGESGKTGGPTGYANTAGIIGIYTQDDANAKFYLEPATVAAPTITNNFDGTITITAASGATIYYTTDGTTPTMSSLEYSTPITLTETITVIKAIAKSASDYFPSAVSTYEIPVCARPIITVNNNVATITCATAGASIFYTTNGSQATTSSTPYVNPFSAEGVDVIRAVATKLGYLMSNESYYYPAVEVSSSSDITNMNGHYVLLEGFTSSAPIGTAEAPFRGQIDGGYHAFALNGHALVGVAEDAIIKNVVVSSVTYSGNGNVGAIVNTAKGSTKIYNCGIQAGSVSGGTNTGGLVGLIEAGSSVRVVNCYNFANVSGSGYAAGIVGKNESNSVGEKELPGQIHNCVFSGHLYGADATYCGGIAARSPGERVCNSLFLGTVEPSTVSNYSTPIQQRTNGEANSKEPINCYYDRSLCQLSNSNAVKTFSELTGNGNELTLSAEEKVLYTNEAIYYNNRSVSVRGVTWAYAAGFYPRLCVAGINNASCKEDYMEESVLPRAMTNWGDETDLYTPALFPAYASLAAIPPGFTESNRAHYLDNAFSLAPKTCNEKTYSYGLSNETLFGIELMTVFAKEVHAASLLSSTFHHFGDILRDFPPLRYLNYTRGFQALQGINFARLWSFPVENTISCVLTRSERKKFSLFFVWWCKIPPNALLPHSAPFSAISVANLIQFPI